MRAVIQPHPEKPIIHILNRINVSQFNALPDEELPELITACGIEPVDFNSPELGEYQTMEATCDQITCSICKRVYDAERSKLDEWNQRVQRVKA